MVPRRIKVGSVYLCRGGWFRRPTKIDDVEVTYDLGRDATASKSSSRGPLPWFAKSALECVTPRVAALEKRSAYWTCDETAEAGPLYYFAPTNRFRGPYKHQVYVTAILDIADDGTLAGVELVDGPPGRDLPPPPKPSR